MAAVNKKGKVLKEYPKLVRAASGKKVLVKDAKEEAALIPQEQEPEKKKPNKPEKAWN